MEVFRRASGTSQNLDLYQEDDALFGFLVKGLSALESFYYGLSGFQPNGKEDAC